MTALNGHRPHTRRTPPVAELLVAGGAGVLGALLIAAGQGRLLVAAAGLAAAAGLTHLAATRMLTFVLVLLLVRSSLDAFHTTPGRQAGSGAAASAVSLLLIVAVVLWFAAQRRHGVLPDLTPVQVSGLMLVAAAALSTMTSLRPVASAAEAARLTSAVAMLVVLPVLVRHARHVRAVLLACYCSLLLPLLFAFAQMAMGGALHGRVMGTFRHPNAFGAYVAVLLVFAVALLPAIGGRDRRLLVVCTVAGSVALLFSYSRGSWIATIAGLLVVAVVQRRAGLIAVLVAGILVASAIPSVQQRMADLSQERTLRGTGGNSFVWRIDYWRTTLKLADDRPGTGIGLKMANFETAEGNYVHNDFVRMYVEAGWVGLLSLLWLVAVLAATAIRALRRAANEQQFAIGAGFAGSLTAIVLMMAGGNIITTVVVLWYFFALAACAHWVAFGEEPRSRYRPVFVDAQAYLRS